MAPNRRCLLHGFQHLPQSANPVLELDGRSSSREDGAHENKERGEASDRNGSPSDRLMVKWIIDHRPQKSHQCEW